MPPAHKHFVVAQLLLASLLVAWPITTAPVDLQPGSKLWVDGTSTVHGYQCRATGLDAVFLSDGRYITQAILRGEKVVGSANLTINAGQLDCGNGAMNVRMRKALKAATYPAITFRLTAYDLVRVADTLRINLTGELRIAGTLRTITLQAVAKDASEGILLVEGSYEMYMTEFGLKPPTLMLGTVKVNDKVRVGFNLVLAD